jgi:hypothetical protein
MSQYILQSLNHKTNAVAKKALAASGKGSVKAQLNTQYLVVDAETGRAPRKQTLRKKGKDLIIEVDGVQVGTIRGFYEDASNQDAPTYRVDDFCNLEDTKSLEDSNKEGKYELVQGGTGDGSAHASGDGIVWNEDAALCIIPPTDPTTLAAAEGLTQAQMVGLGLGALLVGGGVIAASSGKGGSSAAKDSTPPAAPTALLSSASDSGTLGDSITSDNTPTIAGTGIAGDTITIKNAAGVVIATAVVASNGTWTAAPTVALPDGLNALSVTATDPAGNVSPATPLPITIDTTAPSAPGADVAALSDTGVSNTDNLTNDTTPTISGSAATPGDTITVTLPTGEVLTTTVATDGSWSVTPTQALTDGLNNVLVTATDPAGNVSAPSTVPVTIDTTAPSIPGLQIPDAPRGVNAAEASNGVNLIVNLPNDAVVGGTVTSVITKPDGTTLILTHELTAADITAGQITQIVPNPELLSSGGAGAYQDGAWTTSTTLTDAAGNASPAQADGFELSANAPTIALSVIAVDDTVNALEKSGDLPIGGTTTNAEAGQAVTVQLLDGSSVIGTFYTVVQPDGTFALNIPQAQLPGDGNYTLTADVSNFAGTPALRETRPLEFDTTAPVVSVTNVSLDAVTSNVRGTFDGTERGFNTTTYELSNTVTTPPVISGITDAEAGQSVSILLNNVSYTTTVQAGGTWSIALTQDEAKALVHGTTYDISVSVSDLAGNPATPDTDNKLVVNIAPPDVPTVNPQYSGILTPVITGGAQKLDPAHTTSNPLPGIALVAGDTLTITLNFVTVTATIQASGTATDITGVTYNPTTKLWSLDTATAGSFNLADDQTYDVQVSTTTAGGTLTRNDISAGELIIDTTPPVITLNPISPDGAGDSVINGFEQNQALVLSGTTDAQVGSTVTLTGLGGQTYTAIVQAGTNGLNTFSIPVLGTDISALIDGTLTPSVSVTNLFGLIGTDTESLLIDTTAPSAPALLIPEAPGGINAAEAANGTPLEITLPVDAVAGDTVTTIVTNPDGTVLVLSTVLTAADITAGAITQLVPSSALTVDGPWTTSTAITDTAGNTSVPQTGSFTLDTTAPGTPAVALPESLNGVNAAEAASLGGTPLNVTLPGDAQVGDTVTTVVTLPTGSTLTLTHVLTAADITAGSISQLIPTSALTVDGAWTTSTTVTDTAGNVSPPQAGSFILDTAPPAAPAAVLDASSDSGTLGDGATNDTTPTISGSAATPGDTITVTLPTGEVLTTTVATDGSWSVTPTQALTDGLNNVLVTATDPAGNVSAPTTVPVTIDTTAPLAPTATLASISDTGILGDSLTNDNTPTLSGTGVPGDTITVLDPAGNVIATAVVAANGVWSATPTTALPDGLNNLGITATDPSGNTGPAVQLPITIDTTAPSAPGADVTAASDTGSSNTDNITSDNTPAIAGVGATPGDTITVTFPGGEVLTATVASNGTWSVTPINPLPDGANNILVTATDPAGNVSAPTTVPVTIDTTSPAAPGADVAALSDTGSSNTDNVTSDNTPTISGSAATPGDTITVTLPTGEVLTTTVATDGSWSVTPTQALTDGLNNVLVTATDPAGNVSAPTTVPVTIDTTPPAVPAVNSQDTNDSTPVITGTATLGVGESLTVTVNGASYNVTVGLGGVWSLNTGAVAPISGTLGAFVDGQTYSVVATVTDAAGNATSDTSTGELHFDTTAPATPTVNPVATNDSTPVITGTANLLPGETLTITVNGATYTNVPVAVNGTWRLDTSATALTSGALGSFVNGQTYEVVATSSDGASNSATDTSTFELLFDTTAPTIPTGDVAAISDTGISNTDNITSDTTPDIVGTGTPGDTITLYAPNGTTVLGTAVVDPARNWSITPTALPQGTSALQVTATDPAGNTSAPGTVSVTIDTTAPAAPAAILDPLSDSGALGDGTTNDNTPTLSGTGTAGDTITIKDVNGNVIATAVVDSNGAWSATPSNALPNGLNALSVTATDPAGNVSQPTALPVTIDTTAPSAPVAGLASTSDTGVVGDAVTSDTTPTITGVGTPGDTITVSMPATTAFPNGEVLTVVVAPDGSWSVTPTEALANGLNNVLVTATDPVGNISAPTTVPVTIDTTPPAAPSPDVAAASDTGSSSTDNITSDTTPTISGAGTAGDTITLYAPNGTTVLGTAVVDPAGKWSITPTVALPDGVTTLTATATDLEGNTSPPGSVNITVDTTAPTAPVAILNANSDSGNLGDSKTSDTTPTISGTGTPGDTITIYGPDGTTVIATAVVAIDGTWTATPTGALSEGLNNLYITATDPAGNTSLPSTLPITIDTTVAAPVIAPTNGVGDISGTGEPGATVTVMNGSTPVGIAVVDASGNWSFTPSLSVSPTLIDGVTLSATQTDLAGNVSSPDTEIVDTSVPVINPTNGEVLTGTGKPGDTIALTLADGTVLRDANGAPLTAVVDSNGDWSATPGAPVPDGTVVTATASYDADNNPATAPVVRSVTDSTTVDAAPPAQPVAGLALGSDSGTVGDGITSDNTPTISGGGASPGDTIKLYAPDGTTLIGTDTVAPDGTWSITVPTALTDGTHNFQITATDPVGNTSAPTTLPVTIDTQAPSVPAATLANISDSGTLGDGVTSDNTPTITGSGATPGDTISIKDASGNVIATALVAPDGTWSATPASALPNGLNNLSVTATDPAGNTSPPLPLPLTIDTTAPTAPLAELASISDSGTLGDSKTNDSTPTLSGTGTPGDTITVTLPTGEEITAVVATDGTWSITPTQALPEGLSNILVTATDPAGNTSPATTLPITIDTTASAAPAAVLATTSDSGVLGDNTTTDTTPTISGTGMPGDIIKVTLPTGEVLTTVAATDGTWSVTPTQALADGLNNVLITETDSAGNISPATTLPLIVDTTAPQAPAAGLASVSDSGTLGDGITSDNTPTISGSGTPGDTITIKDAAGNVIATAVVAPDGTWNATTGTLPDGVNQLSVTATDPSGNVSAPTALPITVDTSVGAVTIGTSNGIGSVTGTGEPGATLVLTDTSTGLPIGTVTVAPDGTWSVPLSAALTDGTVLSAVQTDQAGNSSNPETETINTAVPVLEPTTGAVITGTGKPGDTIALTDGTTGAIIGSAVVATDGTWIFTPTSPLPDGTTVLATDTSSGLTDTTIVDAAPPALPIGDVAGPSDTGSSNTDNITTDSTPTITGGSATPGDTITLFAPDGVTELGSAIVDAYGNWAITPTTPLTDGVQALKLTATDPLGNESNPSTVTVTIDTTAPSLPLAALALVSDSGSVGDGITNDTTPTISGSAATPGDTITVTLPTGEVLTTTVATDGTWSVTPTQALAEGPNNVIVTATDPAGNTSPPATLPITIDTTVVAEVVEVAITNITTDTGASSTDHITSDKTPTISGTSNKSNRPLSLTIDGVTFTVMTDSVGNWSVDTSSLTQVSGTYDNTVGFADGVKAISVSLTSALGGTATDTDSVTIDSSAPTVVITTVSGNDIDPAINGTFDAIERGFDTVNYTLNSTVTTLPVIVGTTTAEDGQFVTITLNGKTYTTAAAAGAWQVEVPETDALLLNHGNTYAITASVSDKAGNAAVADVDNGLVVNIAPPDVPTVISQTTMSSTPTITGVAQKLNGANTVNLADGDIVTVVIKDAAGTNTLSTYTLIVGGTSSPTGLTYNTSTGAWSLAVVAGVLTGTVPATYNIEVSATTGGVTRSDISSSELIIVNPPVITSIPEAPTSNALNIVEAASIDGSQTVGGTIVNVSIANTGAVAGQTLTLTWGGQIVTHVLTAAEITANTVAVNVPTATLQAETPTNTTETVAVIASLGNGVTSATTNALVNFITPVSPIISNTTWTSSNTTSVVQGIQEAYYDKQLSAYAASTTGFTIENKLYYSEAKTTSNSGTIVRVQLPTGASAPTAGDALSINWGDQVHNAGTLTSANITAGYVDVTVPFSVIDTQNFGNVEVAAIITNATSGNASAPAPVNIVWAYDLPTSELLATSAGFVINGTAASQGTGGGVNGTNGIVNLGDVNGDGYDDFSIIPVNTLNSSTSLKYIVYGGSALTTLELSSLSAAGNTNGFVINGSTGINTRGGDVNGDGYNDIIIKQDVTNTWVVYGGSSSPGAMHVSSITSSTGFKITTSSQATNATSIVGDVNGDGFDDMLFNLGGNDFLLYGSADNSNIVLPTVVSNTYTNGFFIKQGFNTPGGSLPTASGDFNGDGYGDFVVNDYNLTANGFVVFGGPALSNISLSDLAAASRGYAISSLSSMSSYGANNVGDINGDGLDDMIVNNGTSNNNTAYVMFGKTDYSAINPANLGSNGFMITSGSSFGISDVDVIGDFNGDGLADMVVGTSGTSINGTGVGAAYVVFGRTGTTNLSISNLAPSDGFRIDGVTSSTGFANAVNAAGDVNGDGLADILITAPTDDPTGRTDAGITRVIYGGVDRIDSMVYQIANGDAIGTSGVDTLTGTSGNNQLVAGDGNDTLIGAGGADVLYGGRGDDTIVIDASNIAALTANSGNTAQAIGRVDGGNGTDTLQIMASLDLSTISPAAIQSIERINMYSSGTSLTMGLMDVIALSEKNNPFNTATGWVVATTNGATNWDAVNNGAQVVVDGANTNDLYLKGAWQSIGTVTNNGKTYKVMSDLTNAEAQVLVDGNVIVHMAPTVITSANELPGSLNMTEGNSNGGTPVRINLVDTDAAAGMTITLNWGGQVVTATLLQADIDAGYVDLTLTTAQLTAETPIGTTENVNASVVLSSGGTTIAQSGGQPVAVNFVVPTTPIIDDVLWSASNTTSTLSGIPEASYAMDTAVIPAATATVYADNTLYYSEVTNTTNTGSTIIRIQLPTTGAVPTVAGDTLTLRWGDQVINVGAMSAADITNKYKDVTISQAILETQAFGSVVVSADITSATSGNTSLTSPLTVKWAYDLPLAQLNTLSQGFQVEGNVASGNLGVSNENQGAQNVGDVNGDGFDDLEMTDISGNRYIVYGGDRLGALNVADLSAVGNTKGFMIASTGKLQPTRGGDINGDGLSDILIGNGTNSYIIFGKTSSIGKVTLATLGTNGFAFTSTSSINEPSVVGDVNGDGYEDMLFNNSTNFNNYLIFGGTNFTPGGSVALPTGTSGTLVTGTGAGTSYVSITNGGATNSGGILSTLHGDFNGDGFSDFALAQVPTAGIGTGPVYVYYGSSNVTPWNTAEITSGSGRGFQITGLTGQNSIKFEATNMGDVNGDGMDDIAFNDGTTRAFVLFGKTNSTSVTTADLAAGIGGFIVNAGTYNNNSVLTDVDVVGDFNGDGLADIVVSNTGMYTSGVVGGGAYLIYGRTSTSPLTLDNLAVSEGFRITGYSSTANMLEGRTATAAGDMNGDGFADLAITTYQGEATGTTPGYLSGAGIVRIVYGGVEKLESMTFDSAGDHIGTTGADTLAGDSTNNQIVAGDGADTITGAGGADVLYGGRGDDLIVINADNVAKLGLNTGNNSEAIARVDGGSGIDTLRLDGASITLDLSAISSAAIQGMEKVDLTGTGNNILKLSLQDMLQNFDNSNVFNSSNTGGLAALVSKNQLMVDGDVGDKVILTDLANWTVSGTNATANGHTYVVYNHNTSAQQLLVDQLVLLAAS